MKRIASLALVITGLLAAPSTAAAAQSYEVDGARTLRDRIAIGATGAAIVEADHGHVVVTATQTEVRKIRRLGFAVRTLRPPRQPAPGVGTRAFPPADAAYHDYAEMSAEIQNVANANPGIVTPRFSLGTSYEGRQLWAVKVSDNAERRRGRAGGAVHRGPACARAPHDRDGALHAQRADVEVRDRCADQGHRRLAARSGSSSTQSRRRRVRHRHRLVPLVAQEPPAERRLERGRHRPQPQLVVALGLLRRLQRDVLVRDLSRPVGVLGARDAARARLRQQPRRRRRAADQGGDRLPHLLRAGAVALRLHDGRHRGRADADDHNALAAIGQNMAATNGYTPEQAIRSLHRRRHDRRLDVGHLQDLRTTRSRCTRGPRTPASTRPTR